MGCSLALVIMMQFQRNLRPLALLVFIIKFSYADVVTQGINCYQCHSKYDDHCHTLSANSSTYYKPCEDSMKYAGQTPFCRKITQKIHGSEGKVVTVRKCGWVRHDEECYRVRDWDHSETVCQCFIDGCNISSALKGSLCWVIFSCLSMKMFTLS